MTESRKVQLSAELDATGVRKGVGQVTDALRDMTRVVGQESGKAVAAVEGIGSGGGAAAKKVDGAARSIIGSIQRTTAAMQAGERGTASYFEKLSQQRGVSADAIKPYLEQLRQAEVAQRTASSGLDKIGVSAKQTAAALRGVPAQFTDIVTSLQGGQAPLTVFLQQGGQLKDMFGGAGAAARALGGFVLGLVNPFTVAAAAATGLVVAYNIGANEAQAFRRTTILSGQAAGVTAGQLSDMAAAISSIGAGTRGRAAEVLNIIAGSADVGAGNMKRFVAAALQLEKVGGPAAEETAKAFSSLAKEPLTAALKLNEATNFLTTSVYEQIKALSEQGRTVDAARVAQEAYSSAIEQRTPQLLQNLGYVERSWLAIKAASLGALNVVVGIGRQDTDKEKIEALQNRIARIASVPDGMFGRESKSLLPELRQELSLLQEQERMLRRGAESSAQRTASVKASVEWDKETDKYLSKQAQQAREIAKIEALGLASGRSRAEIEKQIGAIKEKFAEKSTKQKAVTFKAEIDDAKEYIKAIGSLQDIQMQATASAAGLSKTQTKLRDVQADPAWANYSRQQREQIITQAAAAQSAEDQAAAVRAAGKVAADAAKDYQQWIEALQSGSTAVARQVQALQDEEDAARIVASGRLSLKAAIEEVTIARLRDQQVAMLGSPDAVLALQREIDAREKLRVLITGQDQRKAAEDTAKEWAKSAEKIGDSITDALMRGFESGKGFAQTLRDTVVNMFKTMVLRPVVSAIVSPFAGAINGAVVGALGLASTGAAASGSGLFGNAAGAAGLAGSFGAFGSGVSSGLTAWGAGGSVTGLLGSGSLFAGGAANGLGLIAGALGPIGLGLGALAAVVKAFDNSGTPHYGASTAYSAAGGLQLGDGVAGLGSRRGAYSDQVQTMTTQIAQTVVGVLDATAVAFGKQVGYTAKVAFADDKSKDPAQGALSILLNGRTVAGNDTAFQRYADGTKGQEQYLARVAADVRTAINAIGLPDWATQLLDRIGAAPSIEQLGQVVTQINATQAALLSLGAALPQIASVSGAGVNSLIEAFGGIEKLTAAAGTYLQAFYSDDERASIARRELQTEFDKLGASVPASREAYRGLVEAQDLTTESGRTTYAALLQLAPAFASLVEATVGLGDASGQTAADVARAAAEMAEAGRKALADLAKESGGLNVDLLRAQGNGAAADTLRRQLDLTGITAGLSAPDAEAAAAAYDYNTALRQQIAALNAAAEAEASLQQQRVAVQAQRVGLEQQLLQLQGDTVELRRREIESLDPSNRALQERINALQDQRAAEQAAAQAALVAQQQAEQVASQAAQRAESVAAQRGGLEQKLLQLQGDTVELRRREIEALDPSNRALQERINTLQDQQAAEQAAAEAAASMLQQRLGLEQQLLQLQGDTAELRRREIEALDPANRALQEQINALRDQQSAATAAAQSMQRVQSELDGLASTRVDLQGQLLTLQGDPAGAARLARDAELAQLTAGLGAEEAARITAAYDYNTALRAQITELKDSQAAAQEAARASAQLQQAWQSITDTIFDEVARIRGLSAGTGQQSLAQAQAEFATTTGRARAGSQSAASQLPALSQALLSIAEQQANSQLDLQRLRGQVAASLEGTGTLLAGRQSLSAPAVNYQPGGQASAVADRTAELSAEVLRLREDARVQAAAMADLQRRLLRVIERWETDGMPETRSVA